MKIYIIHYDDGAPYEDNNHGIHNKAFKTQEEAVQEIKSQGFTIEEPQDETFIENLSYYQMDLGIREEVEEHPMIIPVAFYKVPKEQEHHYWKREFIYIEELELKGEDK